MAHHGRLYCWLGAATLAASTALYAGDSASRDHLGEWLNPRADQPRFVHARSEHFLMLHDTDDSAAQDRLGLLERTRERFFDAFEKAGFKPRHDHGALVCVLFDDRRDFDRYALEFDRADMSWSRGYYSARTNRVALLRWHDPVIQLASAQPAEQASTPASYPIDAAESPGLWLDTSFASVTHEAAHQLAFSAGLQKRGVMYPLWASEGLASNFELASPDQPFGPEYDNPVRRRHLVESLARGQLIPFDRFIVTTRVPAGDPDQINTIYAQAWSVFRYLFTHHTPNLRAYLARLHRLDPGARDEHELRAEFVAAFGPVHQVEAQWQDHLRSLP